MKQWRKKLFSSPAEHAILSGTEHQRKGKFQGPKSCVCWEFVHAKHLDSTLLETWKYWNVCRDSRARTQRNVNIQKYPELAWLGGTDPQSEFVSLQRSQIPNPTPEIPLEWENLGGFVYILCFSLNYIPIQEWKVIHFPGKINDKWII